MAENNRRQPQGSVIERLGLDRPRASSPGRPRPAGSTRVTPGQGPEVGEPAPVVRHCWVIDAPEAPGRWPGLLLEWTRGPDGWRGRVALVADGEHGPVMLTLWVTGDHLTPL